MFSVCPGNGAITSAPTQERFGIDCAIDQEELYEQCNRHSKEKKLFLISPGWTLVIALTEASERFGHPKVLCVALSTASWRLLGHITCSFSSPAVSLSKPSLEFIGPQIGVAPASVAQVVYLSALLLILPVQGI